MAQVVRDPGRVKFRGDELFWIVPERCHEGSVEGLREQWRAVVGIFRSPIFWRIAPATGYHWAFGLALALQALTWIWLLVSTWRSHSNGDSNRAVASLRR